MQHPALERRRLLHAGGYPCIACTAPEFESPKSTFTETPKIAGMSVGLPTDMPKAWFMALSSLSKAATPKRIDTNARADRVRIAPQPRRERS
ncbi:ferredoxin hydrogenase small subunit [Jannaschia seohaensis]|uniref:Ferredoxin hydrogenase small subunit n=1 Tax=Jannaschia seohaensis TaxID=475081 RepID=A0A2Y9A2N9_9RHOB|nr:ferredoxin hydrogenase small subunit [Jannaschia seohaensis]SSA38136.1 ferredoxin hydrogenase small subunit [Jannaschia seohaensis]